MQPAALPKLKLDKRAADAPATYEVACACGAVLRGPRQTHAQTVRCLACQSDRFILPRSPLAYVHDGALPARSEEHTSELQSHSDLVCRLLLEQKSSFRVTND